MSDPARLLREVHDAVLAHESRLRVGPGASLAGLPEGLPLHVLAARAFPTELLDRRRRYLSAVGVTIVEDATVPLTLADRLALLVDAGHGQVDPSLTPLLRALCEPGEDIEAQRRVLGVLDGAAADGACHPPSLVPGAFARLEAVAVDSDRWFGRVGGRRVSWSWLRRVARWAGETKRRFRP